MRDRIIAVWISLAVLLVTTVPAQASDVEPNDSCATANAWGGGGWEGGTLTTTSPQDYWNIPAYRSETISVETVSGGSQDINLQLYDAGCALWATSATPGSSAESISVPTVTTNGAWSARAYCACTALTGYSIGWLWVESNDAGLGRDAVDSPAWDDNLPMGTHDAALDDRGSNDQDWWKIDVHPGTRLTVTLTPDCPANHDLQIYKSDGSTLITSGANGGCTSEILTCYGGAVPTKVYARATIASGASGYKISVALDPDPVNALVAVPQCA